MEPRVEREDRRRRVVIIDDEPANIELLRAILRQDPTLEVFSTTDPTTALDLVHERTPDLVLLDLMMPGVDGYAIMTTLRSEYDANGFLPILVLTADASREALRRSLAAGATDFLTKPFDPTEAFLRVNNLLHTRDLYLQVSTYSSELEQRVIERTEELQNAKLEILERLARATEYRDDDTGHHTHRVGTNAGLLWRELGLPMSESAVIEQAAPLHDVGKIGIPDSILMKPETLTPDEFETIKKHSAIGAAILSGSEFSVLQMGERIARWHHERWDGTGYPDGLSADDIPIEARIVQVCDVFDALINDRPYKSAWSVEDAVAEIASSAGSAADPSVVEAFCRLVSRGCVKTP
jgi:putative two-component system response regulator